MHLLVVGHVEVTSVFSSIAVRVSNQRTLDMASVTQSRLSRKLGSYAHLPVVVELVPGYRDKVGGLEDLLANLTPRPGTGNLWLWALLRGYCNIHG